MNKKQSFVRLATATSIAAGVLIPSTPAFAGPALDRCMGGAAPDTVQTVTQWGTQGSVTYPSGIVNPDNVIYPGDVVRVSVSGSVRYNSTSWTGPDGVGAPDAHGIRPYSSVARWNNNPGGWVGDDMPTSSLARCTSAPSYPVRVLYSLRDADLRDNSGYFTITTAVWRAPGRITIDGTEVTQGVQNDRNQVALVGGKRTFVRVYLRHQSDGLGPMSGVSARLTIDGVAGTYYPIVNPSITTSVTGSDKRTLNDSLLFELPAAATAPGNRQATITVVPPTGRGGSIPAVAHVALSFGASTSLSVIGLRYSYYNVPAAMTAQLSASQPGLVPAAGWWQARPVAAWEPMRLMAENALPLARLTITDRLASGSEYAVWGAAWFDCRAVQGKDGGWGCAGYEDAKNWSARYIDWICPSGGCTSMLLQPEINDRENGTSWTSVGGNKITNMQGERAPMSQGNTLAHELAHSLGVGHTGPGLSHYEATYPRSDGSMGPFVGLRYAPSISLVSGQDAAGNVTAWDLMSYNRPAWLSPWSYCKAMVGLPGARCASGLIG